LHNNSKDKKEKGKQITNRKKMISSFSGLVVGLLAYSAYHAINMMVDKFSINLQATVMDFFDTLNEPIR